MAAAKKKTTTKKKRGRPTAFTKQYKEIAQELCRLGATDKLLARVFGVTEQTINNWKKKHPDFFESLKSGKTEADEKVVRSLFELATGYEYQAQKPMSVSDGQGFGSHVEIVEYRERIPPNATAIIFWLKNRIPEEWRDKQEIDMHSDTKLSISDYSSLSEEDAKKLFAETINKT